MHPFVRPMVWLVTLLVGIWPESMLAHGGGTPRLIDVNVGPYRLYVWSQPDTPRVGEMHFTVAVIEDAGSATASDSAAALDTPILDATVQLELWPATNPEQRLSDSATRDQALFPQYYEADLDVLTEGVWRASVTVTGPEGKGDAGFDFEVFPARQLNWPLIVGSFLLLLTLSAANRIWRRPVA